MKYLVPGNWWQERHATGCYVMLPDFLFLFLEINTHRKYKSQVVVQAFTSTSGCRKDPWEAMLWQYDTWLLRILPLEHWQQTFNGSNTSGRGCHLYNSANAIPSSYVHELTSGLELFNVFRVNNIYAWIHTVVFLYWFFIFFVIKQFLIYFFFKFYPAFWSGPK